MILTQNAGVSVGNKPSVLDLVRLQGAWDNPLLAMFGGGSVTATKHEWITDTIRAEKDNAQVEISNTADYSSGSKVRLSNEAQILTTDVKISKSQQAVSTYGQKALAHELSKGSKEHGRDIEYALLGLGNQTVTATNAGLFKGATARVANTTAGKMGGIFGFIPASNRLNVVAGADLALGTADDVAGADKSLTYDEFCSIPQPIWEQGGDPNTVFVGATLKKVINTFAMGNNDRLVRNSGNNSYDPRITEIYTDFGTVKVQLHRLMNSTHGLQKTLLAGDFSMTKFKTLISTKLEDVSSSDTATVKRYYTEGTLEVLDPNLIACGLGYTA